MLGMDMLIKSLGLDPEEIKNSIGNIARLVAEGEARLRRIEAQNEWIISKLGGYDERARLSDQQTAHDRKPN